MTSWNFVLQFEDGSGSGLPKLCEQLSIPGLPRPCRVLFYACDGPAVPAATAAHRALEAHLQARGGTTSTNCSGPGLWGCMTWGEPSCVQLLVPVIGSPLTAASVAEMTRWQSQAGGQSIIVPALLSGIGHSAAFAGHPHAISRLAAASWFDDPDRLADIVMQRALLRHKPGLFISYRRDDARELVDQLHDALVKLGFRVFLDRFAGTPGRYFPNELAEEMADKAVLMVIETPLIRKSAWTIWEIAFAHRYRLGLLALQLPGAPSLSRITTRQSITLNAAKQLDALVLASALNFVQREHVVASLRRRAFYEGLAATAASQGGGTLVEKGEGVLELEDSSGSSAAFLLPSGRPGQLADVRTLATSSTTPPPKLLLGQHRHLPAAALEDLDWLAKQVGVELLARYDGVNRIRALC